MSIISLSFPPYFVFSLQFLGPFLTISFLSFSSIIHSHSSSLLFPLLAFSCSHFLPSFLLLFFPTLFLLFSLFPTCSFIFTFIGHLLPPLLYILPLLSPFLIPSLLTLFSHFFFPFLSFSMIAQMSSFAPSYPFFSLLKATFTSCPSLTLASSYSSSSFASFLSSSFPSHPFLSSHCSLQWMTEIYKLFQPLGLFSARSVLTCLFHSALLSAA